MPEKKKQQDFKDNEDVVFSSGKDQGSDKVVFYDSKSSKASSDSGKNNGKNHSPKVSARPDKFSRKHVIINVIACIMSVLLIAGGSFFLAGYAFFSRINFETAESAAKKNTQEKSSVSDMDSNQGNIKNTDIDSIYNGSLLNDPMILNIMLFGADTRKGAVTGQSDTMILFSIDTRHKKLKMLSFMRDTYLEIPEHGYNRINASYALGGAGLAVQTIQKNYGIQIDRYAVVDFGSFKNIINTLGGIDIDLTSEEIDYINWQSWTNNQVDTRNELDVNDYTFRENEKGEMVASVHLNGRQALWHARNRGQDGICSGDDYTRTQRQRGVISILINDLKDSDFATIMSVIYEIGPMVTTNLKTSEITLVASNVMKYLKYDIVSASAPDVSTIGSDFYFSDSNNPIYIDGHLSNVIVIYNWNSFRKKVAEFVFEDELVTTTESSE